MRAIWAAFICMLWGFMLPRPPFMLRGMLFIMPPLPPLPAPTIMVRTRLYSSAGPHTL